MNSVSTSRVSSLAIRLILLPLGLMVLSGCVVARRAQARRTVHVEVTPPPAPPVSPASDESEEVDRPPPPPQEEMIPAQPSSVHVWVGGYWGWRAGRHFWQAGRWEIPAQPGSVWIEPRWVRRGRGYVFVAGNWQAGSVVVVNQRPALRPSNRVSVIVVAQPPPPLRHEMVAERDRPSREHVWINGYHEWRDGHHVWIAGHWERPPHAHGVWVEPRWEHQAQGYVFIAGFWR